MKRGIFTMLAFLIVAALGALVLWQPAREVRAVGVATTPAIATPGAAGTPGRQVNVTGVGKVTITPNVATLTFGVDSNGAELVAVQAENATRTQAVIDALKAQGVAQNDLQTTGYNVQPQYDKDQKLTGYRVINTVRVTVRDIKAVGTTIDAAVKAGANRVTGISFDASNKDEAVKQAREAAVANARQKADHYAQLTGATLGPVLVITETGSPVETARTTAAPAAPGSAATPIEPGEGSVMVTIQVSYELR